MPKGVQTNSFKEFAAFFDANWMLMQQNIYFVSKVRCLDVLGGIYAMHRENNIEAEQEERVKQLVALKA
jgi:hypothetical protein